ncbi:DNA repair protein RadC [Sphingomonas leidyi]|uniref:DNA repair protein RadC n=1 Tax=Sphingomonas leidyi TaxID=68569 RepID=A0A7X5ZXL0_9SPHN|nr:JAB domain-containing protein [Sphingomonas leidyi]NIJ67377.1 DNA repair protein RadC [Sphingomonas leidyi]
MRYIYPRFEGRARELLVGIFLARDLTICDEFEIEGSRSEIVMPLERLLVGATSRRAAHLVLAHNHPSGDHRPSRADKEVTRRVSSICDLCGVRLTDHLIIGAHDVTSFRALGLL